MPQNQVSQVAGEVLAGTPTVVGIVSQVAVEVLAQSTATPFVSQVAVEALLPAEVAMSQVVTIDFPETSPP